MQTNHVFPIERIRPKLASLSGVPTDAHLAISLEEFDLDGCPVQTSIHLESVCLPTVNLEELSGKIFNFPINPEPGYINGSVYIEHAHHPVEVTSLSFGSLTSTGLAVTFMARLLFEFEGLGEYANAAVTIQAFVVPAHA